MSNKKAFVLGILTVFAVNASLDLASHIIYSRVKRRINNSDFIVGVNVTKKESKNEDKTDKEES